MIHPFEVAARAIPYQYVHPRILHGLIRWLEPEVVVEVGTHIGMSAAWMARALQENNHGRLYCIDPFCWPEPQEEQWEANLRACGVRDWVTLIRGRSEEVLWPTPVDMAFIDGNHTYQVCKHDAQVAANLFAKVIVLHDTVAWEGSRLFAEEMRATWADWDFLEDNRDCGLLIAKRREPKPASWGQDIGEQWDKPTR